MIRNNHNELFMSSFPDILMVSTLCVGG